MKSRFTTVDIIAIIKEIKLHYVGHRAIQIYDIDNKTFLIKLSKSGEEGKTMLLIESGIRMHITEFDWPKNPLPSGFSMKLRKHIKNRRLESINQLGSDRIIDLQFGVNECSFHLIVELYDRGNLILTDHEYMMLHLVRPRIDTNQDLKFLAREKYQLEAVKITDYISNVDEHMSAIQANISSAKPSDNIRKILSSIFVYGPNLLEHCANKQGYSLNTKLSQCLKKDSETEVIGKLYTILVDAQNFIDEFKVSESKGLIFGKFKNETDTEVTIYEEFHPFEFNQLKNKQHKVMQTFNQAVDEFFSSIESQKSELQVNQKEKAALKKLENIKIDHERRLKDLKDAQEEDTIKGELIQMNSELVNRAILILNHAVANQASWDDIREMVRNGQEMGDATALIIKNIDFDSNHVTLKLNDPYNDDEDDTDCYDCSVDLSMNAFSNARRYFTMKKTASTKEQKTIVASEKALKSAEQKTKQLLNEVQTIAKINKMRKSNWFEKFNWFISSENYLVVGGKDQQQNEHLVKRYFRPGDLYVHADIHGASTVIIKNHEYPNSHDIPPKTLTEAGHMAVIYSSAWESRLSASAWWVRFDQVSKTAPTGEYLTTGSFMIRGKKNYLLDSALIFGFGIMFKITEDSVVNHTNDRRVRTCVEPDSKPVEQDNDEFAELSDDFSSESDSDDDQNKEFPNVEVSINLSENHTFRNKQTNSIDPPKSGTQHRYVTAKERRELKKQSGKSSNLQTNDDEFEEENCEKIIEEADNFELKTEEDIESNELENENQEEIDDVESETETLGENKSQITHQVTEDVLGPLKRRQRNKLKKMKTKYKDQDDEEREMRMAILKGKNPYQNLEDLKPLTKKQKRKQQEEQKKKFAEEKLIKKQQFLEKQKALPKSSHVHKETSDDHDEGSVDDPVLNSSHQIINSLIGNPLPEDELIYALPVLAPYQTLQNYKFKIKMVPGNTKRGKAGKAILFNFMMDKTTTGREKDLLKALKDQDISRNFPGKVKIHAPHFSKANKRNSKF